MHLFFGGRIDSKPICGVSMKFRLDFFELLPLKERGVFSRKELDSSVKEFISESGGGSCSVVVNDDDY